MMMCVHLIGYYLRYTRVCSKARLCKVDSDTLKEKPTEIGTLPRLFTRHGHLEHLVIVGIFTLH